MSQDSVSIGLGFLRLGLNPSLLLMDPSQDSASTLTRHFLANLYSIFLEASRLGLDRAWLLKTRTRSDSTFSDSTHHYYKHKNEWNEPFHFFTHACNVIVRKVKGKEKKSNSRFHLPLHSGSFLFFLGSAGSKFGFGGETQCSKSSKFGFGNNSGWSYLAKLTWTFLEFAGFLRVRDVWSSIFVSLQRGSGSLLLWFFKVRKFCFRAKLNQAIGIKMSPDIFLI